ncbi:MAG: putative toxin-antitoxin system toxin component, PIN family [Helicobacteraceae bacterium]|jgi:putative PIN family toxin of toxin-antitoxin system|nr:putative toxin-antitoxin system toxin component, PIN family [Helicobacteraceae bacterium]
MEKKSALERIVIDTNAFAAAARSRNGASFRLLSLAPSRRFEIAVSAPLIIEYEDAAKRPRLNKTLSDSDIDAILDYICSVARKQKIYYLWRPILSDPKDDFVLELAAAANAKIIVTFNAKDFRGCERFGIEVLRPQDYLKRIENDS